MARTSDCTTPVCSSQRKERQRPGLLPSSTSCGLLAGRDEVGGRQAPEKEPEAGRDLEEGEGRIEPPEIDCSGKSRENEERDRARHTPCGRDYAEAGQHSRDVVRSEQQVSTERGGDRPEQQTDV